ncbi:8-amino-7-oxononanoate synthase [Gammaproteobacteria bacterium 45_16_T64]|nr:8-amino-7-oxononanoate synthase [Gammaproteobacteria bacterium 45_16_T64]
MKTSFSDYVNERKRQGLYRSRRLLDGAQKPLVTIDGERFLAFCSNDYLGLANHPKIVAAFKQAADIYGVGSGASHLVIGHSRVHHELEEALAERVGRDRALLFSSGYMANMGVINALAGRGDHVLEDKLNHASLLDGALLSNAKLQRYFHSDPSNLEKRLQQLNADGERLVVTDTVFSMDGDVAPLASISSVCQQHGAVLMVDDAHGFGVMGGGGAGAVNAAGLSQQDVPVLMATLGKAMGTAGAFIAGSEDLIDYLVQKARTYIYTTALPPAVAAATLESLRIVSDESWRQEKLQHLIKRFRLGAHDLGLALMESKTAIQPVLVGTSEMATGMSDALQKQGVLVTAIRPPTVPKGSARLRVTLSAAHSEEDVDILLSAFENVLK